MNNNNLSSKRDAIEILIHFKFLVITFLARFHLIYLFLFKVIALILFKGFEEGRAFLFCRRLNERAFFVGG